eukprot:1958278-Lingulodinium_polyedra.AAC.1
MLDTRAQQQALKTERKKVTKDLRNAEGRCLRLRSRCKELLPAEDLLEVLATRHAWGRQPWQLRRSRRLIGKRAARAPRAERAVLRVGGGRGPVFGNCFSTALLAEPLEAAVGAGLSQSSCGRGEGRR